jgi:hypothetical protein
MKISSIAVFIFAATLGLCRHVVTADDNKKFCCLCNKCAAPMLERWDLYLNDKGLTCGKLDSTMFNPFNDSKAGSAVCKDLQYRHRNTCCNRDTKVQSVPQAPTPAPTYGDNIKYGTSQVCNLCLNGNKPSKPYTMVTSNQISGSQTCDSIYHLGLTRNINNALCYPMQLQLKGPCGCNSQPKPTTAAATAASTPNVRGGTPATSTTTSLPRATLPTVSSPKPPAGSAPAPPKPAPTPATTTTTTTPKSKADTKADKDGRIRGRGGMKRA